MERVTVICDRCGKELFGRRRQVWIPRDDGNPPKKVDLCPDDWREFQRWLDVEEDELPSEPPVEEPVEAPVVP